VTTTEPIARAAGPSSSPILPSAIGPAGCTAVAGRPWPWIFRVVAIASLFGCAVIHTTVIQPHLIEWMPAGFFFLGLSVLEGSLAFALLVAPSRWMYRIALATTVATLVLWGVSRTMGLPFGPEAFTPEAIGRPDIIATTLGVIRLEALLELGRGWRPSGVASPNRPARWALGAAVVAAVATFTAVGVTGGGGHDHHGSGGHGHGAAIGRGVSDPMARPA
jgi:hypothetical protein